MEFSWEEIKIALKESPKDSSVYIGADSKVYSTAGVATVAYVTVATLHYGSSKGARIFRSYKTTRYFGSIRERLMSEVADAIEAGLVVVPLLEDRGLEIHLDINRDTRYKSSRIVKEATGYVLGTLGIEPKLKPFSFAASSVADRFCVKRAKNLMDSPAQRRKYTKKRPVKNSS